MARIRLNLRRLSVPEKIAKGRQIITAMTNNASFSNPTPPLTDVTVALNDLEGAFASVKSARSEVTTRVVTQDNAETKVDQVLTQLAGYVESVAGKNDTLITGAGMETKTFRSGCPYLLRELHQFRSVNQCDATPQLYSHRAVDAGAAAWCTKKPAFA